jgi:hypothetical protein
MFDVWVGVTTSVPRSQAVRTASSSPSTWMRRDMESNAASPSFRLETGENRTDITGGRMSLANR